jgi:hypothetical protein
MILRSIVAGAVAATTVVAPAMATIERRIIEFFFK